MTVRFGRDVIQKNGGSALTLLPSWAILNAAFPISYSPGGTLWLTLN